MVTENIENESSAGSKQSVSYNDGKKEIIISFNPTEQASLKETIVERLSLGGNTWSITVKLEK